MRARLALAFIGVVGCFLCFMPRSVTTVRLRPEARKIPGPVEWGNGDGKVKQGQTVCAIYKLANCEALSPLTKDS